LVIVQKVPNGTRGKLKLYLKPANTSSLQFGNNGVRRRLPPVYRKERGRGAMLPTGKNAMNSGLLSLISPDVLENCTIRSFFRQRKYLHTHENY
jgi:hypothetical protein